MVGKPRTPKRRAKSASTGKVPNDNDRANQNLRNKTYTPHCITMDDSNYLLDMHENKLVWIDMRRALVGRAVDFAKGQLALQSLGRRVERRREFFAVRAPRRIEFDQPGRRIGHHIVKVGFRQCHRPFRREFIVVGNNGGRTKRQQQDCANQEQGRKQRNPCELHIFHKPWQEQKVKRILSRLGSDTVVVADEQSIFKLATSAWPRG